MAMAIGKGAAVQCQCDLVLWLRDVGGVPAHSVAEHVHLLDLVHGVTLHILTV